MSRSLRLLAHPLALAAAGLIVFNDFVLRPLAPSWWTGKLSDLGALFLAPLVLGALLSPLLRRERLAVGLGGLVAGGLFAAVKLSPALSAALSRALPLRLTADPSDLLALPALFAALWLALRDRAPRAISPRRALPAALLAACVLLADAAAPDYGAACLSLDPAGVLTHPRYGAVYLSTDGGLTWVETQLPLSEGDCPSFPAQAQKTVAGRGETRYRLLPGDGVEQSPDGGATWSRLALPAEPTGEAERAYIYKLRGTTVEFTSGPLDMAFDPGSGNLILAMGQDGVAVWTSAGEWAWAPVGPYRRESLRAAGLPGLVTLLGLEALVALSAALTWTAARGLRLRPSRGNAVRVGLGWAACLSAALLAFPTIQNQAYTGMVSGVAAAAALLYAAIGLGVDVVRFWNHRPMRYLAGLLPGLAIGAVALLPYGGSARNLLPHYWMAVTTAGAWVLLVAVALLRVKSNPQRAGESQPSGKENGV